MRSLFSIAAALILPASVVSEYGEGAWTETSIAESTHSNYFGSSCSLSKHILAVGAPYDTPKHTMEDAGVVNILERTTEDELLSMGLEILGDEFDQLGSSVAVSKGVKSGGEEMSMVVIGAPRHSPKSGTKVNIGMAKVFYYSEFHEKWMQLGQDITGTFNEEFLGEAVAISDDGLVIAVATAIGDEYRKGRVEMYRYSEIANEWELMGTPLVGKEEGAKFGTSVSIAQKDTFEAGSDKYYVAIGAPQVDNARGLVQVYHWDTDTDDWKQVGRDITGFESNEQLGYSVSMGMKSAHLYLAVGSPSAAYYNGKNSETDAHVQVYKYNVNLNGETEWFYFGDEIDQWDNADGTGTVVELSSDGTILAIGSPDYEDGKGMVRIFEYNYDYGDYVRIGQVLSGDEDSGFGACVSIYDNQVAIGAPYGEYVQLYEYDPKGTYEGDGISSSKKSKSAFSRFGTFLRNVILIGLFGGLMFFGHLQLKKRGFKYSSFFAALPGAGAIRHRGREQVDTEEKRDEWPFNFFSASERARIEEIRKAEEGAGDVDGVVLHGMPKSLSQDGSKNGSEDDEESVEEMRQIT